MGHVTMPSSHSLMQLTVSDHTALAFLKGNVQRQNTETASVPHSPAWSFHGELHRGTHKSSLPLPIREISLNLSLYKVTQVPLQDHTSSKLMWANNLPKPPAV